VIMEPDTKREIRKVRIYTFDEDEEEDDDQDQDGEGGGGEGDQTPTDGKPQTSEVEIVLTQSEGEGEEDSEGEGESPSQDPAPQDGDGEGQQGDAGEGEDQDEQDSDGDEQDSDGDEPEKSPKGGSESKWEPMKTHTTTAITPCLPIRKDHDPYHEFVENAVRFNHGGGRSNRKKREIYANQAQAYNEIATRNADLIDSFASLLDAPPTGGRRVVYGQETGLIEDGDIWKYATNSSNYRRDETGETRGRIQVGLLADDSGSMSGYPIDECRTLIGVMTEALSRFCVDVYVGTINGASLWCTDDEEETVSNCLNFGPHGFTPTAAGLTNLGKWILSSEGDYERRVVFVVTDGGADEADSCRRVCESLRKSGVEVFGFGVHGCNTNVLGISMGFDWCYTGGNIASTLPVIAQHINRRLQ
jgi:hypothetical protein